MDRCVLHELDEDGGRQHVHARIARLLGGHPLLHAALQAIGVADIEFRWHAPEEYAAPEHPPAWKSPRGVSDVYHRMVAESSTWATDVVRREEDHGSSKPGRGRRD